MVQKKPQLSPDPVERPPTFPCDVLVQFADGDRLEGKVHLVFDHSRVQKISPLSEILNSRQLFMPLEVTDGKVLLLSLDNVLSIETDAKSPAVADQRGSLAYFDFVKMTLMNGSTVSGVVSFIAPDDRSRMSDFFNRPDRFVGLEREQRFTFVRKGAVRAVTFWEEENMRDD